MSIAFAIENDWPKSISEGVVSPSAYLRIQAAKLPEMTNGIIGAILEIKKRDKTVEISLILSLPALDGYQKELLTVSHDVDRLYPALIQAEIFEPDPETAHPPDWGKSAKTYQEFRDCIREVFNHPRTVGFIQSLIAKSNEVRELAS